MPSLGNLARVTRRGGAVTPPGITIQRNDVEDSVETKSWLIYTAMLEAATRGDTSWKNPTPVLDEEGRVVYVGSLKQHARSLYPAVDWSDQQAAIEFTREIYKYLRVSGNARVVQRNPGGDTTKAVWSLAPEWGTGSPATKMRKAYAPSKTEQKVTPTEAGEDRSPSPVVVVRPKATPEDSVTPKTPKNKQGNPSKADLAQPDGTFKCPECGDVRPTFAAAIGHFGSKHRQPEKFPIGKDKADKTPRVPKQVTTKVMSASDLERSPNAAFAGTAAKIDKEAVKTGDPEWPWGCPWPGCEQKFKAFQGVGGHLSKHNATLLRERLVEMETQIESLSNPAPGVLLKMLGAALTAPKAAPEDKTKMETLQIEVNRLNAQNGDLLRTIKDQQTRLDKQSKQIAALLSVE